MNISKNLLAAAVSASLLVMAGSASAAVVGGGATLPEDLYGKAKSPANTTGILFNKVPTFDPYVGVGSGNGKRAFFNNNSDEFKWDHDNNPSTATVLRYPTKVTVDYAGSDSLVTQAEREAYDGHATLGKSKFGALIQIPTVLTSVTVPYNLPGRASLQLTSAQLAGIFAGTITNWNQIDTTIGNLPIKVVFRKEGSGTTEIFLRHLKAVTPGSIPAANPGNNFATAYGFNADAPPTNFIAAEGSDAVVAAVNASANVGAIGYVGPDKVAYQDATKVAAIQRTNTTQFLLPTQTNVRNAVSGVTFAPPSGAAAQNAENWGIGYVATGTSPLARPANGYPIVGVTNLILSQCYASSSDSDQVRAFVNQHYNTTSNDTQITQHAFVKLPESWRTAVYNAFYASSSAQHIGNPNVCSGSGIGRPQ